MKTSIMRTIGGGALATMLAGLLPAAARGADVTPAEARAIAKDAYIYGFPLVDNYRIMFGYWVNQGGPEYKGPINTIQSSANVYGPEDTAIQTPNSDTPKESTGGSP